MDPEELKKIGDENEARGLNRDGTEKPPTGNAPGGSQGQGVISRPPNAKPVTFSPEQITLINQMFEERMKGEKLSRSPNSAISLYNLRDPKEIKTVNVSRFDGKWVIGFKDLQNDPYKKTKQYLRYGVDPIRKLPHEPYVTLLLTEDGEKIEEKEVMLLTFMENRERENPICRVPVIEIIRKEKIHDHGILGNNGNYAIAIDDKGNPENRTTILQQSKSVELRFIIQPQGFKKPHEFITDFLA